MTVLIKEEFDDILQKWVFTYNDGRYETVSKPRRKCPIQQFSDQMVCSDCGMTYDIGCDQPECER